MNTVASIVDGISEVLVVEDDAGDAYLAAEYIAEQSDGSVRTIHASTLHEALQVVSSRTSCVLLDLNLPDADGMTSLTALIDAAPAVPVVVLTGLGGRSAGVMALNAGAQDYLEKNELSSSTLWRAIRFAVERRRSIDRDRALLQADLRRDENRRLTRGLLPTPRLRTTDVEWTSRYAPASAQTLLGGDFIDAVETADGTLRVVIGDVCGHGPEEAALGACLRIGWRALVLAGADQRRTLMHLEQLFDAERHSPSLFTTLCDVSIDASRRNATVLSAGHDAPLLIEGSGVRQLQIVHGPLLGFGFGIAEPTSIALPEQWMLLLFTDGIVEGKSAAGGRLGVTGFRDLVAEHVQTDRRDRLLTELITAAENEHGGPLPDDVALFLLSTREHR